MMQTSHFNVYSNITENNNQVTFTQDITTGIYKHYKGKYYLVLFCSTHTETEEKLVIYQSLYGDFGIWARPLTMFLSDIEYEGQLQLRFKKVAESSEVARFFTL